MRATIVLAAVALAGLLVATPASALPTPDPTQGPIVSTGAPCLNGGINLYVFGQPVLQCFKVLPGGPV